jgi:hypothetical protein
MTAGVVACEWRRRRSTPRVRWYEGKSAQWHDPRAARPIEIAPASGGFDTELLGHVSAEAAECEVVNEYLLSAPATVLARRGAVVELGETVETDGPGARMIEGQRR